MGGTADGRPEPCRFDGRLAGGFCREPFLCPCDQALVDRIASRALDYHHYRPLLTSLLLLLLLMLPMTLLAVILLLLQLLLILLLLLLVPLLLLLYDCCLSCLLTRWYFLSIVFVAISAAFGLNVGASMDGGVCPMTLNWSEVSVR